MSDDAWVIENHCPICGEYESECTCSEEDVRNHEREMLARRLWWSVFPFPGASG